jgi:serine/threonine-protein kinase
MEAERDPIDKMLRAVLEHTPTDWDSALRDATAEDRELVAGLREMSRITAFHHALQQQDIGTAPERWGDLLLLERLGSGAQADVYRAWDPKLQREVALKLLRHEMNSTANAGADSPLVVEGRAAARIRHPNVVTVHGIDSREGRVGLWMELVRGATLDAEVRSRGPLTTDDAARLGHDIGAAVVAVHAGGLVHRDIKPANIVHESEGRWVLADFGLGMRLDAGLPVLPSGTPLFMAPELFTGTSPSVLSDVYALGMTMWFALAGRPPFTVESLADLRQASRVGPRPTLAELRPDLPIGLVEAVQRAIAVEPAHRFADARQFTDALEAAATSRRTPARSLRSRVAVTAAIVIIAAGLAAITASRLWRGPQQGTLQEPASEALASIAVLPFVNRANVEEEYIADGLADELLNLLAKIDGVRVAARTSTLQFKGKDTTIAEIGKALNVDTVLEGSVRKAGDRWRISVRLIKVADGYSLWSEIYDRNLDDLFAVQDDIAQSVVGELRTTILGGKAGTDARDQVKADVARAAKGRSSDPEAYRIYLMARHMNDQFSREETAKAIEYLEDALERDPKFALAWGELSRAFSTQAIRGWTPAPEGYERSRDAAARALTLEPDLAEGHSAIGWIYMNYDWDWRRAQESFSRALELAPGNALLLRRAGTLATAVDQLDDAIAFCRKAVDQDPLNAGSYNNLAQALYHAGRDSEAEQAARHARDLAPQSPAMPAYLSLILLAQGRGDEALVEAMRDPDEGWGNWALAIIHHAAGRRAESDAALRVLVTTYAEDSAYQIAEVHAARGETSAAFEWLERAYAQRDTGLCFAQTSPLLRSLHSDPRWDAFMKKMGFAA